MNLSTYLPAHLVVGLSIWTHLFVVLPRDVFVLFRVLLPCSAPPWFEHTQHERSPEIPCAGVCRDLLCLCVRLISFVFVGLCLEMG